MKINKKYEISTLTIKHNQIYAVCLHQVWKLTQAPEAQAVEHPLLDGEVVDSIPGRNTKGVKNGTSGYLAWCSAL